MLVPVTLHPVCVLVCVRVFPQTSTAMVLLRLETGAFKTLHPAKGNQVNADFTMASPHFTGVFDGVSGVTELGMKPEDLSYHLREHLRTNLNTRLSATSKVAFDHAVADHLDRPRSSRTTVALPGEWLLNLVAYSLADCPSYGSTTMAVCSLLGSKMSWYNAGDVRIVVYRRNIHTCRWQNIFETKEQRQTVRTHSGTCVTCPYQLKLYTSEAQTPSNAYVEAQGGEFGCVPVMIDDIVVIASDGVTDNVSSNHMKERVTTGFDNDETPYKIAHDLVVSAVQANKKPDDTSAVVAFVRPLW